MKQLLALAAVLSAIATPALAGEWQPYSQNAFDEATRSGKTVVVDFHANWCSTCKKQKQVLEGLSTKPELESVVGFTADYDKEKDLEKQWKVQKQSTLIVFKGAKEVARSTGLTNETEIEALIKKGI